MKCPDEAIWVRELDDGVWGFEYPRLDPYVREDFEWALENLRCGDVETAEDLFRRLIKSHPEFIDAYHHLAILLDETGRDRETAPRMF
jgi:hypothetical protein